MKSEAFDAHLVLENRFVRNANRMRQPAAAAVEAWIGLRGRRDGPTDGSWPPIDHERQLRQVAASVHQCDSDKRSGYAAIDIDVDQHRSIDDA